MDAGKGGAGEGAFRQKQPSPDPHPQKLWLVGRPHGGSSVMRGSGSKRKEIRRLPYGAGVLGRPSVAAQSRFRTARPLSFYLVDAAEVAAAFKSGVQEQFRDVEGHALAGHALAEASTLALLCWRVARA